MTSQPLLTTWIIEAVGVPGGSSSPLAVAKDVWLRHEQDIKSAGDLLFTWQLDLRVVAADMVAQGRLSVDESGDWTLPEGTVVPQPVRRTWTEPEIATAVQGYLAMWQADQSGRPLRRSQVITEVEAETGRSGGQLNAMMSNISQVVQEHGHVPLASYPPRSNVPAGVRPAVASALSEAGDTL